MRQRVEENERIEGDKNKKKRGGNKTNAEQKKII